MSDLNKDIDEVLKNLKLAKKSLSNVYLNLIDENDDDFFKSLSFSIFECSLFFTINEIDDSPLYLLSL